MEYLAKEGFGVSKGVGLATGCLFTIIDYGGNSEYGVTRAAGNVGIALVSAFVVTPIAGPYVAVATGVFASSVLSDFLNFLNDATIKTNIANGAKDDIEFTVCENGDNSEIKIINNGINLHDVKIKKVFDSLSKVITTDSPDIKTGENYTFKKLSSNPGVILLLLICSNYKFLSQ